MRATLHEKYNINDINDLNIYETEQLFDEYEARQEKEEKYTPTFPMVATKNINYKSDRALKFCLGDGAHFIQDK